MGNRSCCSVDESEDDAPSKKRHDQAQHLDVWPNRTEREHAARTLWLRIDALRAGASPGCEVKSFGSGFGGHDLCRPTKLASPCFFHSSLHVSKRRWVNKVHKIEVNFKSSLISKRYSRCGRTLA